MKRLAFRIFIASVVFNATLAIVVLLAGDFGETEGKIVFSSVAFSGAVLLAIASEAGRGRGLPLMVQGLGTLGAGVAFVLLLVGIWTETDAEWLWKLTGTAATLAVLAPTLSLLAGLALLARFEWLRTLALALASLLAAMLIVAIWAEVESGWFWRVVGVVAVALASTSIVIAVLQRVRERSQLEQQAREDRDLPDSTIGAAHRDSVWFCPRCGEPGQAKYGQKTHCTACGAAFVVYLFDDGGDPPTQ